MQITLRQFEIFSAVVEAKQVTKASRKLHITQSAVSLALNELENQMGGALFDRDSRTLILNDRGRYLLPICREILSKTQNVWELMNAKNGVVAGTMNFAASSTIGNYVLPHIVSAFRTIYPDIYITIEICNTRRTEQRIVERKVDLGFVEGEVSNDLVLITPWIEDELVIIVNPHDNFTKNGSFNLSRDMEKSKWVMREKGSGTAQIFKQKIGDYVTNLNVVMELGHTEAIKKAVEWGTGFGCVSNLAISREIERGDLQELQLEGINMKRKFNIIQHKNKVTTHLMDKFLSFCDIISRLSQKRGNLTSSREIKVLLKGIVRREINDIRNK